MIDPKFTHLIYCICIYIHQYFACHLCSRFNSRFLKQLCLNYFHLCFIFYVSFWISFVRAAVLCQQPLVVYDLCQWICIFLTFDHWLDYSKILSLCSVLTTTLWLSLIIDEYFQSSNHDPSWLFQCHKLSIIFKSLSCLQFPLVCLLPQNFLPHFIMTL